MEKKLDYNVSDRYCKYLGFDSNCDGYCSCRVSKYYRQLVVDDMLYKCANCEEFDRKEDK